MRFYRNKAEHHGEPDGQQQAGISRGFAEGEGRGGPRLPTAVDAPGPDFYGARMRPRTRPSARPVAMLRMKDAGLCLLFACSALAGCVGGTDATTATSTSSVAARDDRAAATTALPNDDAASASPSPTAPHREAPGYRDVKAIGTRIALPDAELFVPEGFRAPDDGTVALAVHFQGGAKAAQENFVRSGRRGVLIASTLSGRSGAFSAPYRDPATFARLLEAGERALSTQQGRDVKFGGIAISFFSAGYGAVRELLKDPTWFQRIDALVSADSMYATVVAPAVRAPRIEDCEGFVRFAQAAARGEKTFVVAYGMYPTDYASTSETAALLCASVAGKWTQCVTFTERGVPIERESHIGSFHCYEFAEATAGIHVDLLYFVPEMFRRHVR